MVTGDEVVQGLVQIINGLRVVLGLEPPGEPRLLISFIVLSPPYKEVFDMLTMTSVQTALAKVAAVDAEGHPVGSLGTAPVWSSANEEIVVVKPSADGMTCSVESPTPGQLGKSTVSVKATVGGKELIGTAEVEIVAADAVKLSIEFETPA